MTTWTAVRNYEEMSKLGAELIFNKTCECLRPYVNNGARKLSAISRYFLTSPSKMAVVACPSTLGPMTPAAEERMARTAASISLPR